VIFVLGGHGFVGSAFTRYCVAHALPHAVIQRDNYRDYIGKTCDVLINANGNSGKRLASQQPVAEFDASVRSVRASLVNFKADYYVHLSSCDVYPDCSSPASTGEDAELDVARQSPYGFHKYLAELCVQHVAKRWLIVRMGGFVGPGMRKNAIFDILHGGPLWLDAESELQFLHTDDHARLVYALVEQGVAGDIINLCGQGVIRLSEVVAAVGMEIATQPGSPRLRYDVSIEKALLRLTIPLTRKSVLDFVESERSQGGVN
jgi:nucleoside-diphosphate-sugar epimerase